MTISELDERKKAVRWLIAKRSSSKLFKSLLFGTEQLERLIDEIADIYGLSESDRESLRPSKTIDTLNGAESAAGTAVSWAKTGSNIKDAAELTNIAKAARKSHSAWSTAKAFVGGGKEAARVAAGLGNSTIRTAKAAKVAGGAAKLGAGVAGKANVILWTATAVYGVATTGIFTHRALTYSHGCHQLLAERCILDDRAISASEIA